MAKPKRSGEHKLFAAALRRFPQIVEQKRRAHLNRQKVLARFAPLSRQLLLLQQQEEKDQTIVREHVRRAPITLNNPDGETIVRQHLRRVRGTKLSSDDLRKIFERYDRSSLLFPTKNRLKFKDADKYDEIIAIWIDYFARVYVGSESLSPNVVKALIASESGFRADPSGNQVAIGIAQITRQTLAILKDSQGEAKDFIFEDVSIEDLKSPEINIALAVRWLFRKRETAAKRLRRPPTAEELILEYKGLLRSKTQFKNNALGAFRSNFDLLNDSRSPG